MAAVRNVFLLPSLLLICILSMTLTVLGQSAWNWNQNQNPGNNFDGKYGASCDDSRLCNQAENLFCRRYGVYGIGRCDCNPPWVYVEGLKMCRPASPGIFPVPNQNQYQNHNPHHHYNNYPYNNYPYYNNNQNQALAPPQQPPSNPFPSANGNGNNFGEPRVLAGVGSPCTELGICVRDLGSLSRCIQSKCECYDSTTAGRAEVAEHNGRCYMVLKEGDICTDEVECRLGSGGVGSSNSRCIQDYEGAYQKHCRVGDGSGSGSIQQPVLSSAVVALLPLLLASLAVNL